MIFAAVSTSDIVLGPGSIGWGQGDGDLSGDNNLP